MPINTQVDVCYVLHLIFSSSRIAFLFFSLRFDCILRWELNCTYVSFSRSIDCNIIRLFSLCKETYLMERGGGGFSQSRYIYASVLHVIFCSSHVDADHKIYYSHRNSENFVVDFGSAWWTAHRSLIHFAIIMKTFGVFLPSIIVIARHVPTRRRPACRSWTPIERVKLACVTAARLWPAIGANAFRFRARDPHVEFTIVFLFFFLVGYEEPAEWKCIKLRWFNHSNVLRGASPLMGQKIDIFFHHYSIAYAFRNTHVKFQTGIRKIVEVMNFFVTSCSTSVFGTKNFKRVFPETMFFKLACTITKEQLDIFQKFLYRIKLY